MSKPWKLRVDWTCHRFYGDPVVVELHIMDEYPKELRQFTTIPRAVEFAVRYMRDRGMDFLCDVDRHQRCDHTYVVMHARPPKTGISEKS